MPGGAGQDADAVHDRSGMDAVESRQRASLDAVVLECRIEGHRGAGESNQSDEAPRHDDRSVGPALHGPHGNDQRNRGSHRMAVNLEAGLFTAKRSRRTVVVPRQGPDRGGKAPVRSVGASSLDDGHDLEHHAQPRTKTNPGRQSKRQLEVGADRRIRVRHGDERRPTRKCRHPRGEQRTQLWRRTDPGEDALAEEPPRRKRCRVDRRHRRICHTATLPRRIEEHQSRGSIAACVSA